MNVIPHNKASDKVKYKWAFWNSVTLPRYWGPSWCHGRPDALLNDPISPESFSVFFPVLFYYYYLRHFVGNYNWSQKSGAERPSNWRGATLQAIHHLPAACLSYSFLCLSPSLSTTLSVSVPTKKKGTLPPSLPPSLQTPHLSPPHAVLSGSLV